MGAGGKLPAKGRCWQRGGPQPRWDPAPRSQPRWQGRPSLSFHLWLGNFPSLGARGLNTTPQLIIKYKEQTRQQPGWIKEVNAYKSALSPWKKGDTKHKASFPSLQSLVTVRRPGQL